MEWFFVSAAIACLFFAASTAGKWPAESLWILVFLVIIPVYKFLRQVLPGTFLRFKLQLNLHIWQLKKNKILSQEIQDLKTENLGLKEEIQGLHKIWMDKQTPAEATQVKKEKKKPLQLPYNGYLKDFRFGLGEDFEIKDVTPLADKEKSTPAYSQTMDENSASL